MKYMGSKKRLQKYITPIINKLIEDSKLTKYVEPFVGGANMIESIVCDTRIGYDNNEYLIALLDYVSKNGLHNLPKTIDREHYNDVREDFNNQKGKYQDYYIGYIGFMGSYNGRFFDGGYSGHQVIEKGRETPRDRIAETIRNLEKQVDKLVDIEFKYSSYEDLNFKCCLIYCDIPYKGTKQYSTSKGFNYDKFYKWCIEQSKNNIVLVSEYDMPSDIFEEVWSKEVKTNMRDTVSGNKKQRVEKLFKVRTK